MSTPTNISPAKEQTPDNETDGSANDEGNKSAGTTGSSFTSYFPEQVAAISKFLSFRSSTPKPEFPPSSWDLSQSQVAGAGASEWKYDPERWQKDIVDLQGEVKEEQRRAEEEEKKRQEEERSRKEDEEKKAKEKEQNERQTIAQRIRALLGSTPYAGAGSGSESTPRLATPTRDATEQQETKSSSSSIFPTNFMNDNVLMNLLHSESVMNGVASQASKGKDSVWSYLERMGPLRKSDKESKSPPAESPKPSKPAPAEKEAPGETEVEFTPDENDIMMYAPLHPDSSSQAELADSDELEYAEWPEQTKAQVQETATSSSTTLSPGDRPTAPEDAQDKSSLTKRLSTRLSSSFSNKNKQPATSTATTKREWHPSPTQISLHATWWGYRLYLPPPILAALSDAHLTAAKRGAIVTAALKWLLDSVPIMLVPPTLRPAIAGIKRLSPFLGYIGAFVAWSWEKIKQQDKGDGVILTATWLVPLALIPDAWDHESHGRPVAKPIKPKKSIFSRTKSDKAQDDEKVGARGAQEGDNGKGKGKEATEAGNDK